MDLASSSDDECKLPLHSIEGNTYSKQNRKNDTYTGKIYDAASLLNIILCNPRESHSVCQTVGIK